MTAAIYTQRRKAVHFTEALLKGFPATQRPCEAATLDESAELHILGGLQFGCLELMGEIRRRNLPYVFWDNAYIGGGTGTDRLRITLNGYQKTVVDEGYSLERFERFGGRLAPWRGGPRAPGRGHVLVVPPGDAIIALFGLQGWLEGVQRALRDLTDREVDVSRKGDPRPLAARLDGCYCVVTWSSNVAVEAVLAGVPAIVSRESAASPVSDELHIALGSQSEFDCLSMPDREAWAASLAWGQFSTSEISSGFARDVILGSAAN